MKRVLVAEQCLEATVRLVSILLALQFAVSMLGQSAANKATVVPDTLPLHEDMSADSRVVGELRLDPLLTQHAGRVN